MNRGMLGVQKRTPPLARSGLVAIPSSIRITVLPRTSNTIKADLLSWKGQAQNSNLLFLPDLHSLNPLKGQLVPGSIINPGGRRTGMAGNPLSDLDGAARIHVFGDARGTETVTTNSFQDPACPGPFLDQL